MTDEPATKVCNHCYERKPLTEFYNLRRAPDGHDYQCKVCSKAAVLAYTRRRREENPEEWRRTKREIVARHRERTGNARDRSVNKARRVATQELVAAHRDEFDTLFAAVKDRMGLLQPTPRPERTPRPKPIKGPEPVALTEDVIRWIQNGTITGTLAHGVEVRQLPMCPTCGHRHVQARTCKEAMKILCSDCKSTWPSFDDVLANQR